MLYKGYDRMVDLWSLGVFLFEMLAGYAPFESRNQQQRCHKILSATISFPGNFDPDVRPASLDLACLTLMVVQIRVKDSPSAPSKRAVLGTRG
jgi:serine/threonine protein kinase